MEWVPVGKISRTHGLKGEFKFHPFVTEPEILQNLHLLKLQGNQGQETEQEVVSLRELFQQLVDFVHAALHRVVAPA